MNKSKIRAIVALLVVLALYNLVVFLVPFAKTATFWWSYGFTWVSFIVVAAAIYIAFIQNPDARSRFYGFPIAKIGAIYGRFQLIAGLIFMAVGQWVSAWVAIVVYAIALGAAALGLISADAVVDEIRQQDTQLKKDVSAMRAIQSKMGRLAAQCQDPEAAAAVEALAEEIRYSDPVSNDSLTDAEADLGAAVDELVAAVVDGDSEAIKQLCRKATALLNERNRLCKLNKHQ